MRSFLFKLSAFLMAFVVYIPIRAQVVDPVKWSASYKPLNSNSGEIIFIATIDKGYHIYGAYFEEGGPIRTNFNFPSDNNYTLIGKLKEVTKPVRKKDPAFDNMEITLLSNKAIFSQQIELKKTGELIIPVEVEYMACTDETCLPPVRKTIEVKIKNLSDEKVPNASASNTNNIIDTISSVASKETDRTQIVDKPEENGQKIAAEDESLLHFLIIAFLAGLAAILTPCVFPMIPMTVSFFMRPAESKMKNRIRGVTFGLFITLLYGLVGLIVSLTSVGAGFAAKLSYHWLPNLIFFALFVIFSLSFLGLFEIVLPSSLVNSADSKADKGGWLGIFFMALTTVLVSFSCTGPIVGALLVEAMGKFALKPILGMTVFGLAFALPFTFFAIFPTTLSKLPKSGGWLNEVKVVLGTLMLAFGIKFLINIDQTYHLDIISRDFVIIFWIVLALFLGVYLLGKIRLSHDSPVDRIGVFRLLLSLTFFYFAIYLFSGLLGKNQLNPLAAFLPANKQIVYESTINPKTSNTNLCDTPKYADILTYPAGIPSYFDYEQARACARKLNKPILIDFKAHSCSNCKKMEATVWSIPEVKQYIADNFVVVALYTDERTLLPSPVNINGKNIKTLGEYNLNLEIELFKTNALPLYAIVHPDGKVLAGPIGTEYDKAKYLNFLKEGVQAFRNN
ncbi:MAG: thioredoxin family protein [Bacteroidales bacterium]|nr:thioredoxin family protein [Bacteroidales bacterium]